MFGLDSLSIPSANMLCIKSIGIEYYKHSDWYLETKFIFTKPPNCTCRSVLSGDLFYDVILRF